MILPAVVDARPPYPARRRERDGFILARRPARRHTLDPFAAHGTLLEPEPAAGGGLVETGTIFLTGRECPWRCAFCDLWQFTTPDDTPAGAIAQQIERAVDRWSEADTLPSVVKLYNAGSFFDARAVPPGDDAAIAGRLAPFSRVVVESHPALIGDRTWRLRDRLAEAPRYPRLEVAMGLETAHPAALAQINKGITVEDFRRSAHALAAHGVDLRVFLLIHPPFVPADAHRAWLVASVDVAVACGAATVSLIPTRAGNGTLEVLADDRQFSAPTLEDVETAAVAALGRLRATAPECRLLVDTWELDRVARCPHCAAVRRQRLVRLTLEQRVPPALTCAACGEVTPT